MEEKKLCDGCMNTTTNDLGMKVCEFNGMIITTISPACDKYNDWSENKEEEK